MENGKKMGRGEMRDWANKGGGGGWWVVSEMHNELTLREALDRVGGGGRGVWQILITMRQLPDLCRQSL